MRFISNGTHVLSGDSDQHTETQTQGQPCDDGAEMESHRHDPSNIRGRQQTAGTGGGEQGFLLEPPEQQGPARDRAPTWRREVFFGGEPGKCQGWLDLCKGLAGDGMPDGLTSREAHGPRTRAASPACQSHPPVGRLSVRMPAFPLGCREGWPGSPQRLFGTPEAVVLLSQPALEPSAL